LSKALLDLTNAYLALEGLLKTRYMSPVTRRKIEDALKILNREAAKELRRYEEPDDSSTSSAAD
jgi:hypothetical protein